MTETKPPIRDNAIDCVGGIMILFMVYRHCLLAGSLLPESIENSILCYPLLFFMHWFFFKGGMYYHETELHVELKKSFDRLLLPYLAFAVIAVALSAIAHLACEGVSGVKEVILGIPSYLKKEGTVLDNAPLWFLLSLFFARVFFSFSRKLRIPAWIVATVAFAAGWVQSAASLPVGLYFGNIALGLAFFSLGYILKDKQYEKPFFIGATILYFGLLILWFATGKVSSDFRTNAHSPYLLVSVFSLAGCLFFNNQFKRVTALQNKHLAFIGEHSLIIYVTHFIFLSLITYLNGRFHLLDGRMTFLVSFVLLVIVFPFLLLPGLVRFFNKPNWKWMIGKGRVLTASISEKAALAGVSFVIVAMVAYLLFKAF